jgi:hypothetical protein
MPAATPHTVTVTSVSNQADVPYATELNAILGLFRSLAEQIDAHGRAYAPARVRFAVLDGPADEPQTRSWPVGVPMPTLDLDGRRAAVVSLTDSNATAVIRLGPAGESWVARAPTGQPVRISWRYAMPDE